MRGYSVLFVCALCVFVLCGAAAAVVAQDLTPEKAAGEAKCFADRAKQKGEKALANYKKFEGNVDYAVERMNLAVQTLSDAHRRANEIPKNAPYRDEILRVITVLEEKTKAENAAVEALAADAAKLKNQISQNNELEEKMKVMESAAITKAGDLQTAAEAARDLWAAVVQKFTTQLEKVKKVLYDITKTKDNIDKAYISLPGREEPYAKAAKQALLNTKDNTLKPALEDISGLQTALQAVRTVAEEARKQYDELAKKASELQGKAGERSHRGQNTGKGNKNEGPISTATSQPLAANSTLTGAPASKKTKDYGAGPLCSLGLSAFFMLVCVVFWHLSVPCCLVVKKVEKNM